MLYQVLSVLQQQTRNIAATSSIHQSTVIRHSVGYSAFLVLKNVEFLHSRLSKLERNEFVK